MTTTPQTTPTDNPFLAAARSAKVKKLSIVIDAAEPVRHMANRAASRIWLGKRGAPILVPANESVSSCGSVVGVVTHNPAIHHITCPTCADLAFGWERFNQELP